MNFDHIWSMYRYIMETIQLYMLLILPIDLKIDLLTHMASLAAGGLGPASLHLSPAAAPLWPSGQG